MNTRKNRNAGRPAKRKVKNHALIRAAKLAGGVSKLSKILEIPQPSVSDWIYKGINIPAHHVPKIVKATYCKVRPEELRSDIEWDMPKEKK